MQFVTSDMDRHSSRNTSRHIWLPIKIKIKIYHIIKMLFLYLPLKISHQYMYSTKMLLNKRKKQSSHNMTKQLLLYGTAEM